MSAFVHLFNHLRATSISINHLLSIFLLSVFLIDLWNLFTYDKISPFPAYRLQTLDPIFPLTFDLVNGGVF